MKILLVTDFFPTGKDLKFSGGVEARTFFLAKALSKKNTVTVITSRQPHTKETETMLGFKIYRTGLVFPYNSGVPRAIDLPQRISFILSAIRLGKSLKADLVDGGNFLDHFIAKQIGIANGIPVVYWYPDVFLGQWIKTTGIVGGIIGTMLEKYNLRRAPDHFIAISRATKKKLIRESIDKKQISVINCGVDQSEFKNLARGNNPVKTITVISRLIDYKRIKDIILAFALLLKKGRDIKLTVIGTGPEKNNLIMLTKALKLEPRVKFMKNLPRKRLISELTNSDIFCLPSSVEGFGISVIEAAAAGVPYVISDIEVFKEITHKGRGGLLFELGNIRDLSDKIELLLTNKNLYKKKQKEAISLSKEYDWKDISLQTETLYKKIISKRTH